MMSKEMTDKQVCEFSGRYGSRMMMKEERFRSESFVVTCYEHAVVVPDIF